MTWTQQVESELCDRLENAFEQDREIVRSIRGALRLGQGPTSREVWRIFVRKIIRELDEIEHGITARRCAEVKAASQMRSSSEFGRTA